MKKHCNHTEKVEIAVFLNPENIPLLTIKEFLQEIYFKWLGTIIKNSTYFKE